MLTEGIIKRLTLARYFWRLAGDNARAGREVTTFAAINLLHDGVEYFLLAALEQLNTGKANANFEQYLDMIDARIDPKKLPFRTKLLQLNRVRVNAKHHGVRPDAAEVARLVLVAREFFEEAARSIFDVDFWTISLIDLLDSGKPREYLEAAQKAFENGDYATTLIGCRKAFYDEFEWRYDIKMFETEDTKRASDPFLMAVSSDAPYYVKNKKYIDENVREPFDYVVVDYERQERELASNGIDHAIFSNIKRLTPAVYREKFGEEWIVRHDCAVFDTDGIADRASYVLESTIDVILTKHVRRRSVRSLPWGKKYFVDLKREEVPLYRNADRTGTVVKVTPKSLKRIHVESSCVGLRADGIYWKVNHDIGDNPLDPNWTFLWGYLHEDEVES